MSLGDLMRTVPPLDKINVNRMYHSWHVYECGGVEMKQFDIAVIEGNVDNVLLCLFVTPDALEDNLVYFVGDVVAANQKKVVSEHVKYSGIMPIPEIGFYCLYENIDAGRYFNSFIDPRQSKTTYH